MVINKTLLTGIFPNKLKIAKVIALFKKGDKSIIENYRPISILPSISKVFGKIIFNQLYDHFQKHNLFFNGQYGFRRNHSTELATLDLIEKIQHQLDTHKNPFAIFVDLSKTFDTIDHDILLKACAQRFRYALFAFIHTQTYFEYYTLTLRLASLVKKAVIYAYWTKELFDICRENVSYMATLPSVARHVIHADDLRPRH